MLLECELSSQVLHTAVRVFVILPELKTSPEGNSSGSGTAFSPFCTYTTAAMMMEVAGCAVPILSAMLWKRVWQWSCRLPEQLLYRCRCRTGVLYLYFTGAAPAGTGNLPLSDKREENFVAGLSMGGYGAFKMALTFPERFGAAVSMSGVLDIVRRACHPTPGETSDIDFKGIFLQGRTLEGTDDDLFALLKKQSPEKLPVCMPAVVWMTVFWRTTAGSAPWHRNRESLWTMRKHLEIMNGIFGTGISGKPSAGCCRNTGKCCIFFDFYPVPEK